MGKNEYNYFKALINMTSYSCDASTMLCETLSRFDKKSVEEKITQIHSIENTADGALHEMMKHLAREFLPPVDREDIILLAQSLDDVTDAIDDILMSMHMFSINDIRPDALIFTQKILECCNTLKNAVCEFENFRRSKTLHALLVEVDRIEEEGDRLYYDAMHRLYAEETDAVEILRWSQLYDKFEKCCDACETVASAVGSVVMKNS